MKNCNCNKPTCSSCEQKPKCSSCESKKTCNSCESKKTSCSCKNSKKEPVNNCSCTTGYEIRTTIDKNSGKSFFPKTHTKAVVNSNGDTLDCILNSLNVKLNDVCKAAYSKTPGEIKIKDDFYSDTAFYALSARKGYELNKELENIKTELDDLKLLNAKTNKLIRMFTNFITPEVSISTEDWKFNMFVNGKEYAGLTSNLSKSIILKSQINKSTPTPIKVKWNVNSSSDPNNDLYITNTKVILHYKKFGNIVNQIIFNGISNDNEVIGYIIPDSDISEINAEVVITYGKLIEYSGNASLFVKDEYNFETDFETEGVNYLGYTHMDEVFGDQTLPDGKCKYYSPKYKKFIKFESEEEQNIYKLNPGVNIVDYLQNVDKNKIYYSLKQMNDGLSDEIRYFFYTEIKGEGYWIEIDKLGNLSVMNLEDETKFKN